MARQYYFTHFGIAIALFTFFMGNFYVTQDMIVRQYTPNKVVRHQVLHSMAIIYLFILNDTIKSVYKGTTKAMGIYK